MIKKELGEEITFGLDSINTFVHSPDMEELVAETSFDPENIDTLLDSPDVEETRAKTSFDSLFRRARPSPTRCI